MPDSTSLKEFVRSVRKRERYYSQCASEIDTSGILFIHFIFIFV